MLYCRSPPRPSPASVAYNSDDDRASTAKAPLPDDDDDSSMTEKPSDFDSTEVNINFWYNHCRETKSV